MAWVAGLGSTHAGEVGNRRRHSAERLGPVAPAYDRRVLAHCATVVAPGRHADKNTSKSTESGYTKLFDAIYGVPNTF